MKKIDEYMKAFLLEMVILLVTISCMTPLFINKHQDIPLGLLLGGLCGGIPLALFSLFNKKEENSRSLKFTIIIIVIRFLLVGGTLVLSGFLYYKQGIKIFNLFATLGGYVLSTICLAIVLLISKKGRAHNV